MASCTQRSEITANSDSLNFLNSLFVVFFFSSLKKEKKKEEKKKKRYVHIKQLLAARFKIWKSKSLVMSSIVLIVRIAEAAASVPMFREILKSST